jgi:phosphoketolase
LKEIIDDLRQRAKKSDAPRSGLRSNLRRTSRIAGVRAFPSETDLEMLDRYWRAANFLSVGQIYLLDNPLLREPLQPEHIKPRLLGHWGTTPGLNFIYAHLNRAIKARDLNTIFVCGPGHGGPGMVANTYLEGTYTEIYPDISRDTDGLRKLFRQFLSGRDSQPCCAGDARLDP